jgi:CRISPR/Cas system-associated exonuclease Cas4 (RecB family)
MILDHSARHVYQECKRKYYWTYVLELSPGRSDPMERGSLAHRLLYNYYQTKDVQSIDDPSIIFERPIGALPEEEPKYQELERYTRALVRGYVKELVPQDDFTVVSGERFFAAHMGGENYYVGVVDQHVVVTHIGDMAHEFKTSGQIASDWVAKFQLDNQTTGYVYLMRRNNIDAKGTILSVLRTSKYPDYVREALVTPEWQLKEFESELQSDFADITMRLQALATQSYEMAFPKSTGACFSYNHKCPFHKLCTETPEMRTQLIREGFYPRREPRELGILEKALAK